MLILFFLFLLLFSETISYIATEDLDLFIYYYFHDFQLIFFYRERSLSPPQKNSTLLLKKKIDFIEFYEYKSLLHDYIITFLLLF